MWRQKAKQTGLKYNVRKCQRRRGRPLASEIISLPRGTAGGRPARLIVHIPFGGFLGTPDDYPFFCFLKRIVAFKMVTEGPSEISLGETMASSYPWWPPSLSTEPGSTWHTRAGLGRVCADATWVSLKSANSLLMSSNRSIQFHVYNTEINRDLFRLQG